MKTVKLGIIGYGNIGSMHAGLMMKGETPEITLSAIADRLANRREAAKKDLPSGTLVFHEGEDLIKSGCCDAVLIATPHDQHPGLSILSLQHGVHVLCEKPAGVDTLSVRQMNRVAQAHPHLVFGMMFNQRTNPLYIKMKEMLQRGDLGELKRVNWIITDWYRPQFYYDSGAWRATWAGEGGGVLLNQCPHQLDLLQWLCGMPAKVTAIAHEGKWHQIEVEDDVTVYLEYENGASGVFVTSTGDAPGTNRLEISGSKGRLVCENNRLRFDRLLVDEREWNKVSVNPFGKPPMDSQDVPVSEVDPQHAGVLRAFAASILRKEPLVARGEEGLNGLMLSNAMHLSSWLKQPVILPFDEAVFLAELNKRRATSRYQAKPE